jgi:membrane-bound lytic murein transglycosylase MltF
MRPPLSRAVLLALLLAACSSPERPDAPGTPADLEAEFDEEALLVPPRIDTLPTMDSLTPVEVEEFRRRAAFGDLDSIVRRRYLRIAVPWSRTWFYLDGVRPAGFAEEFGTRFTAWMSDRTGNHGRPVHAVFIPVHRDDLIPMLERGEADIALGGLTVSAERATRVDFSHPLGTGISEIPVTGPRSAPLADLGSLSDRVVLVRRSSIYWTNLSRISDSLVALGRAPIRLMAADETLEDEDILAMVSAGLVDVTVTDSWIIDFFVQVFDSLTPHPDLAIARGASIAAAIRKGTPRLRAQVNAFVRGPVLRGGIRTIVMQRYLKKERWVGDAVHGPDRARFDSVLPVFREKAATYDIDPYLLLAVGYQESKLNQAARSRAGAVGVMQIIPRYAAGPPVRIRGVDQLDRNVEAGAKYLRILANGFKADSILELRERWAFALAAYNAGPGRVAGLRRMAARRGLDPDKWFGNVEVVAAREIGRETVTYVRNVFSYYLAYRLVEEQGRERD